jgi:uncharacterized membrane protein YwzB
MFAILVAFWKISATRLDTQFRKNTVVKAQILKTNDLMMNLVKTLLSVKAVFVPMESA